MAKQDVFEVLQALGGSATKYEIWTYMLDHGTDAVPMTVWQDCLKLLADKRVKFNRRTEKFTITGKSAARNVVELNADGTISRRLA